MKVKTALILAAGKGSRLQALGKTIPKGFLQLGDRPIIEESIQKLIQAGISRIVVVTGHQSDHYESLKETYKQLVTVCNPYYANSGSLYSLYCAREFIKGDFLLLESDLIYESRALDAVLDFPRDHVVLLSDPSQSGDEVYVSASEECITAISKDKSKLEGTIAGEFTGICKISETLFQKLLEIAKKLFEESLHQDYESDGLAAIARSSTLYYKVVPDLLWAEIDMESHLVRAKEVIYPTIIEKV